MSSSSHTSRGTTLCGVGGGIHGLRITPDEDFSSAGPAGRRYGSVCPKCLRIWSTQYATQMEGWTKHCGSCGQGRPVTAFASDGRAKDGLAKSCEQCQVAGRRALAAAESELAATAGRYRHLERLRAIAREQMQDLATWQSMPWLPTYACATSQHVLRPDAVERTEDYEWVRFSALDGTQHPETRTRDVVDVVWRCACGTAPVDERVLAAARAIAKIDEPMVLPVGSVDVQAR